MADLIEARVGEDASGPDEDLAPGDVLAGFGDHRVALEGSGIAASGEVDCGAGQGSGHTAAPKTGTRREAGDRLDAIV